MDTVSKNVLLKGQRLYESGAVLERPKERLFDVVGDSGTYLVTVTGRLRVESCTCPSYRRCSHIHAVSLHLAHEIVDNADQSIFEGLY